MNANYEALFELVLENNYFTSNVAKNLQLGLNTESKKVLKNYQLLFKPISGKNLVLYNKNNSNLNIPEVWNESETKLSFFILNNDYQFLNYTNLPQSTDFHYFNNKESEDQHGKSVFKSFLVKLKNPIFDYIITPDEENKKYEIIDNFNKVLLEGQTPGGAPLLINLQGEPEGRYRLKIDDQEKLDFYTFSGIQQGFFGVIEIYLNEIKVKAEYLLRFQRRSTFWQYIISYPKSKDWHFKIQQKKGEHLISFQEEPEVEKEGKKWVTFSSCSRIPFSEIPEYTFELEIKPKVEGFEESKKIGLPNPNVEILGPMDKNPCDESAPEGYCSKMYIYV